MAAAYLATDHGPRDGDTTRDPDSVTPALIAAHHQLAGRRSPGAVVAVYGADHPAGAALQAVTEEATMLLDSVAVLLHRLGIPYTALMAPVFPAPTAPSPGFMCSCCPTPTARRWPRPNSCCRWCSDARQVAEDSAALATALGSLADTMDDDDGSRFPSPDRHGAAKLLRWLADGTSCCSDRCAAKSATGRRCSTSPVGWVARLRTELLPELTKAGELLFLAQGNHEPATAPTRTSSWFARPPGGRLWSTVSSGCSPARR